MDRASSKQALSDGFFPTPFVPLKNLPVIVSGSSVFPLSDEMKTDSGLTMWGTF